MTDDHYLSMDQLQVGLHVHLDLKWYQHPFAFNHFKIRSEDQITAIRTLGLQKVRYSPGLSEESPPPSLAAEPESDEHAMEKRDFGALSMSPAKREKQDRMRLRQLDAERIEEAFIRAAEAIRNVETDLYDKPTQCIERAADIIAGIVDSILSAPELAIQFMGDSVLGAEDLYFHSLNVTVLSMMVGRNVELPAEAVSAIGMGALLHDLGLTEVPNIVLRKKDTLTPSEQRFYEMHCQYGVEIAQILQVPPAVQTIIREHHELFDGTGFPERLKGESTSVLSRIVAITNYYDELCNPTAFADALTPHEALSFMFAKLRSKFDPKLLRVFIRCLGVYPPGTIVQLSNGAIGMVATVNTERPMKPTVVVYDAFTPKEEAILLDMDREFEVSIAKAVRPAQVPREVYSYLSLRKRVSYYFDVTSSRPAAIAS